ncbi:MAG: HlyD family secretion protein [Prevotellaceae bacterium]|jgi:membrane fusion protein (multidrug efflux system)|nr:HlyD family secretion protein [Prevotellaceae bacterium]
MKKQSTLRKIATIIGSVLVICGIICLTFTLTDYNRNESTNDAQIEQYVSPVNVRTSGYVKQIFFTEYQFVHKGDTLLLIDDSEHKIRLQEATAALMDARNGAEVLNAGIATGESNASVYNSSIAELEVKIDKLKRDYGRYQNLLQAKAVTPMQVESVKAELDMTQEHLNMLRQQQHTAQSNVREVSTRKGNNEAQQLKAAAAVDLATLNLSYTVVIAPCDGILGRRTLEEGQLVTAGQTITYIVPDSPKWIVANFKETQVKNLHTGQKVRIVIDAFSNTTYSGHITSISGATGAKYSLIPVDNSTGNFIKIQQRIPVKITFDNLSVEENRRLAAGMMVVVKTRK